MPQIKLSSEFLEYLAALPFGVDASEPSSQLPSLINLSKQMGVSVASLREQLEVAKALGLIEVRPRLGMRKLPYSFQPAVRQSLAYAISLDWEYFLYFSDLRDHIEAAYWQEAAGKLTAQDIHDLKGLLGRAWSKLRGFPIQIPHSEHKQLHLTIFKKIENPFVLGLLEAYWDVYEAVGFNLYADYDYLKQVWGYHQQMVDAIDAGDWEAGYQALILHKDLLFQRSFAIPIGED